MQQAQPARLRACWRTKNNTTSTFFRLIDECDVECCCFFLQIGAGTSPGEAAQLELRREGKQTLHTQIALLFTRSLFCACVLATSHSPCTRHKKPTNTHPRTITSSTHLTIKAQHAQTESNTHTNHFIHLRTHTNTHSARTSMQAPPSTRAHPTHFTCVGQACCFHTRTNTRKTKHNNVSLLVHACVPARAHTHTSRPTSGAASIPPPPPTTPTHTQTFTHRSGQAPATRGGGRPRVLL